MNPALLEPEKQHLASALATINERFANGITPASEDFADDFIVIVGGISQSPQRRNRRNCLLTND